MELNCSSFDAMKSKAKLNGRFYKHSGVALPKANRRAPGRGLIMINGLAHVFGSHFRANLQIRKGD